MSDKLLERIAVALEAIVANGGGGFVAGAAAPAKPAATAKAAAAGAKAGAAPKATIEDVRAIIRDVAAIDKPTALKVIQAAGVSTFKEVKPEHFDKVVAAGKKALAAHAAKSQPEAEPTVGDIDDDLGVG